MPGAVVTISGANSPASLASRPIRFAWADEVDKWPASVGTEGDPLALLIRRQTAFRRRKTYLVSTPTVAHASRIWDWWEVSDQRRWYTPCPRCGEAFVIEWSHLRWDDGLPATARIECPACGARLGDRERPAMMAAGQWRATAPFTGVRGYHCWEVVAPWRSLAEIVTSFLVAKRSIETLRVWRNTCVAELGEEPGESVDPSHLLLRREAYPAEVPRGVCGLVCGVDMQDDRLEALVCGYGPGEECWVIARESLPGDPSRPEVWALLDQLLLRGWAHESGLDLRILSTAIDTAGHRRSSATRGSSRARAGASTRPSAGAAARMVNSCPRRSPSVPRMERHCAAPHRGHRPGEVADLLAPAADGPERRGGDPLPDHGGRAVLQRVDRRAGGHPTEQVRRADEGVGARADPERESVLRGALPRGAPVGGDAAAPRGVGEDGRRGRGRGADRRDPAAALTASTTSAALRAEPVPGAAAAHAAAEPVPSEVPMTDDEMTPEQRASYIKMLCREAKVSPALAEDYIKRPMSLEEIRTELLELTWRRTEVDLERIRWPREESDR